MSLQNNRFLASTTIPRTPLTVLPAAFGQIPKVTGIPRNVPCFLVVRDKAFASWWGSLRTLCSRARPRFYTAPVRLFRHTPVARFRLAGRPLLLSILLHIAGFLWYPYLPAWTFPKPAPADQASVEPAKIYYRLTMADFSHKLVRITPLGTGGHPASALDEQLPKLGSTLAHPKITIVLRPPRPDNRRQTIHQSQSAPDLRIATELQLPNIITGAAVPPRPQIHFTPNTSRPNQSKKNVIAESAPAITTGITPSIIPVAELASAHPNLPVPPPAAAETSSGSEALVLDDGALLSGRDSSALVIVGTDPSAPSSSLALPSGNRWAELSVSPTGGAGGSPAGIPGGSESSGRGGSGKGGDASGGRGRGGSGAGGGEGSGTLSIGGEGTGTGTSLADPLLPANMVYAVQPSVLPRKNALVVSAGPMGGGGLDAYGALHCGKIDTVFLQMPGKSWTLQYCEGKHESATDPLRSRSAVIKLESGLTPPDAELKFDFRRLPLPPESVHKVILLKGLLREDGTVDQVQVYRHVQPQMDEAARLAFSRWKFKPAMKEGRPISVEILVGVPSDAPPGPRSAPGPPPNS